MQNPPLADPASVPYLEFKSRGKTAAISFRSEKPDKGTARRTRVQNAFVRKLIHSVIQFIGKPEIMGHPSAGKHGMFGPTLLGLEQ